MRVFINITYDLKKQVLFQKTMPFLLEKLKVLNLVPERIVFAFQHIEEKDSKPIKSVFEKMIKNFPELSGYKRPYIGNDIPVSAMSNLPAIAGTEFCEPIKDSSLTSELFCRVTEKIPKPYPFYSAAIMLDQIAWFGKVSRLPALSIDLADSSCAIDSISNNYSAECSFYQSDCIVMDKRFDWGNSYNPVHVRFEVTRFIESGDFSAADSLIEQLNEILGGTFQQKKMVCCYSGVEIQSIHGAASRLEKLLDQKNSAWKCLSMPSGHPFGDKHVSDDIDSEFKCPPRLPFFKKVFKGGGFLWHNPSVDSSSEFTKIISNGNYALNVSPWFNHRSFYARLDCTGCNFSISHMIADGRWCSSLKDAELCAEDLKTILSLWEAEVIPEIRELFGETPDWYRHSISFGNTAGVIIRNKP